MYLGKIKMNMVNILSVLRKFIYQFITLILIISGFSACSQKQTSSTVLPNILLVIADDWSYPHAGAYGDTVVKTPVFDRIAREGVLFDHAYISSPSCTHRVQQSSPGNISGG